MNLKTKVEQYTGGTLREGIFMNPRTKQYIDNTARAKWYIRHDLWIVDTFPTNVVVELKSCARNYVLEPGQMPLAPSIESIIGYSHRGSCPFKIGDRLFSEDYVPVPEDYTKKEWASLVKEANNSNVQIIEIMRFIRRGKSIIKTWEDAVEAATNFANYIS